VYVSTGNRPNRAPLQPTPKLLLRDNRGPRHALRLGVKRGDVVLRLSGDGSPMPRFRDARLRSPSARFTRWVVPGGLSAGPISRARIRTDAEAVADRQPPTPAPAGVQGGSTNTPADGRSRSPAVPKAQTPHFLLIEPATRASPPPPPPKRLQRQVNSSLRTTAPKQFFDAHRWPVLVAQFERAPVLTVLLHNRHDL